MTLDDLKHKIIPVLKRHSIKRAGLFGSLAKGTERAGSDVDLLIEIGRQDFSLLDFVGVKLELEDALGRKVDLVEYSTLKPLIKQQILTDEVPVLWPEK